jgi:hypothetical protein
LGHFIVACGDIVQKVYVWPHGIAEEMSVDVAKGILKPEIVQEMLGRAQSKKEVDDLVYKEKYEEERKKREEVEKEFARQVEQSSEKIALAKLEEAKLKWNESWDTLYSEKAELAKTVNNLEAELKKLEPIKAFGAALQNFLIEIGAAAPTPGFEPGTSVPSEVSVSVQPTLTEYTVKVPKREVLEATDKDVVGQILILASKGWFKEHRKIAHVRDELERKFNSRPRVGTIETALGELVAKGVLEREREGKAWNLWLAPEAEKLIKVEEYP